MPEVKLGRLESVSVSEVWKTEPRDFTPWLAEPENLKLLCDILELEELVDVQQEGPVGRFRVDITAQQQGGGTVLIENQFGPTDHGHLGQVMTSLAGQQGPVTAVWIAERFNEEHRAVFDWMNANTGDDYAFFAVEVEVLRIGDSHPAPWFNVVAKPNTWNRAVRVRTAEGPAIPQRMAYWQSFSEYLETSRSEFRIKRAVKDSWFEFPTGRSGSVISATISVERFKRIGVELYNKNDVSKSIFDQLYAQKREIDTEIGEPLDWQRLDAKKATRIVIYKTDTDPADPAAWPYQHAWMLAQMIKFKNAFGPRLKALTVAPFQFSDGTDAADAGGPEE